MKPELRFDQSVIPPGILLILLIILGIVIVRSYRKEGLGRYQRIPLRGLCAFRIAAIAAVIFILLKPVWFRLQESVEAGTVLILVDASESMEISDAPGRRLEKARSAAKELAGSLDDEYRVRSYGFAAYPEIVGNEELGSLEVRVTGATNIGGSIQEAAQAESGSEIAAIILLSDGQHNSGTTPREVVGTLRERSIPVFTVGIGAESRFKDLELREFSGPRAMFREEEARCTIRVVNYGFDEQEVPFRIRIEEHRPTFQGDSVDPRSGQAVVDRAIPLPPPGTEERHTFAFTPEFEGVYRLSAEVERLPGEEVTENNVREMEIEVTRERLRVLLVESTPRWEYGFVLRSLRTDRRFAAAGLIQIQDGTYRFQGVELNPEQPWANRLYDIPLNPDWSRVDAVILGDVPAGNFQLEALEALRDRIQEKGMVLIMIPGPRTSDSNAFEATPLGPLLPLRGMGKRIPEAIRVAPSSAGTDHPIMRVGPADQPVKKWWDGLHPLWGLYPVKEVAAASLVLAEAELAGEVHPVISFRHAGQGKILQLAVDDTWRWRVQSQPGHFAGSPPSTFWRQAVRWLITGRIDDPGGGVRLLLEKSTFTRGERVDIEARVEVPPRLQGVPLRLTAEMVGADGMSKPVTMEVPSRASQDYPGTEIYRYSYVPLVYGSYQIRAVAYAGEETVGRDEASFSVAESGLERARASLDRPLLEDVAHATGGRYFDADEYQQLPPLIPERKAVRVEPTTTRIWDSPAVFGVVVLAIGIEWLIRKRKDMA